MLLSLNQYFSSKTFSMGHLPLVCSRLDSAYFVENILPVGVLERDFLFLLDGDCVLCGVSLRELLGGGEESVGVRRVGGAAPSGDNLSPASMGTPAT